MPNHDEQMNRRREKREALRKRQQAQARRLWLTAFAAVLVLAACGGLIWYLTKGTQEPEVQTQAAVEQTTAPTETEAPDPRIQKDPLTTIHIRAAGDLNITDSVISSGVSVGGYDFGTVFKDVSALLSDADLTVMNFEGNTYGEPYGTASSSAPNKILEDLRGCGVDLLQMANSCSINNGLNGLSATLQSIRAAGIEPVGAYANQTELNTGKGYTIAEAQGIKVAFVAFTKGMGGRGLPAGSEGLVNVLYEDYDSEYKTINTKGIETILKNVQAEDPDLVVALVHWGSEYNEDISSSQESIITLMQKRGVDVILGTHPHTLQPIVYDPVKGTLVAYSLGDFFGDANRAATNYSIILDLEITKDATTGNTKVTDYSYFPIYTVTETESADQKRRVVRIDKALEAYDGNYLDKVTQTCQESMVYALTRIEERLVMQTEEDKK